MAPSSVYRWFEGSVPRRRQIKDLAAVLRVSENWLAQGEGTRDVGYSESDSATQSLVVAERAGHYHDAPGAHSLDLEALPRDALAALVKRAAARLDPKGDPANDLAAATHLRDLATALEHKSLITIAAGFPEANP